MALISHKVSVITLLSLSAIFLLIYCVTANNKTNQPSNKMPPTFCYGGIPGMHGKPGSPGAPGRDGRDGRDGAKGDQGSPGKTGPQGPPGSPGMNGKNGIKGEPGVQCPLGQKGQRGESGTSGIPGTPGVMTYKNWKECAWKNLNDGKDHGLIKDCVFFKNFSDTSLHVYWTGALRIYNCNSCCKRWFFTFNGTECSGPLPIDGIVHMYQGINKSQHRVRNIEGHCNNIHKGKVRVGFWVGNCADRGNADAYTGWNSVSRIFIEEVPRPQA